MKPESEMMSIGYNPEWSEGSVKLPIFQTSTFVFKTAEEGRKAFSKAYGVENNNSNNLIYSRINNPNMEVFEERIKKWDGGEAAASFSSGMAAISTTLLAFLKPGESMLSSSPLYGGTDHFMEDYLKNNNIQSVQFKPNHSIEDIKKLITIYSLENLKVIFVETPANPTNALIDIQLMSELAKELGAKLIVDNTYLGPIWQNPLKQGADIVIYSATKYIGGHSDIIAGVTIGSTEDINEVKGLRTFFGNMCDPNTCWLMLRSLETLKVRMDRQADSARVVANYLKRELTNIDSRNNPINKIKSVSYLGFCEGVQKEIFDKQCLSPGAMISFELFSQKAAYNFLDKLKLVKLAVSFGSTESLAQHPHSMTHIAVDERTKGILGITPELVRLSIGVEDPQDIIDDITQALS